MSDPAEKVPTLLVPDPLRLTPDIQRFIIERLYQGHTRIAVCRVARLDERVVSGWITQGLKDKSGIYHDFAIACDKAVGDSEIQILRQIRESGKKDWRALAWIMERRWPERWGKQRAISAGITDDAPKSTEQQIAYMTLVKSAAEAVESKLRLEMELKLKSEE